MKFDKIALLLILVTCALGARFLGLPPGSGPRLPAPKAAVHLVPLFGETTPDLTNLQTRIESFTGRPVVLHEPVGLDPKAFDSARRQFSAELLCSTLESAPGQFRLAITDQALFTSAKPEWGFCFGTRFEGGGLISSARRGDAGKREERLAKMSLRYVLEGAYAMQRVNNPRSLLHSPVLGAGDLDNMEYRL